MDTNVQDISSIFFVQNPFPYVHFESLSLKWISPNGHRCSLDQVKQNAGAFHPAGKLTFLMN